MLLSLLARSRPTTSAARAASRGPGRRPAAGRSRSGRSTTARCCASAPSGDEPQLGRASSTAYLEGEHADLDDDDAGGAARDRRRCRAAGRRSWTGFVERRQRRRPAIERQKQAVLRLLQALAALRRASRRPARFDAVLRNVADSVPRMSPEVDAGAADGAAAGRRRRRAAHGIDLGGELRRASTTNRVARFVAENVAARSRRHGAGWPRRSRSLVPDEQQRTACSSSAEERAAPAPLGQDPQFDDIWADRRPRC